MLPAELTALELKCALRTGDGSPRVLVSAYKLDAEHPVPPSVSPFYVAEPVDTRWVFFGLGAPHTIGVPAAEAPHLRGLLRSYPFTLQYEDKLLRSVTVYEGWTRATVARAAGRFTHVGMHPLEGSVRSGAGHCGCR